MNPASDMNTSEEMTRTTATCETCHGQFSAAVVFSPFNPQKELFRQKHCGPCIERRNQTVANEAETARQAIFKRQTDVDWGNLCPIDFRAISEGGQTDVERLAKETPQLAKIVAHPLGDRGLILRGGTGAGKTRSMYRLFRTYFDKSPRPRLIAMTSGQFDRQCRDAAGTFTLSQWFDRLAKADALFIDDIGKGKWTPATASQFWELVDDRTRNRRPIFLTTNLNGETLVSSLGLDRDIAEPLLRRIRETCDVIVLNKEKKG